jgi:hypothetical protein
MISNETKEKLILGLLNLDNETVANKFYEIGEDYVVRTVTMIYLGKLKAEFNDSLILEDCAWIPDTSRWSEFLQGKKPAEMEPYPEDVIVYKGGFLDATKMKTKIKRELL